MIVTTCAAPAQWLQPISGNLPAELIDRHQWVLWCAERRGSQWTKPPYQINGTLASHSDPLTWDRFDYVESAFQTSGGHWDGYGFVLSAPDPYVGIDLDHCRDAETGEIKAWAFELCSRFSSFAELSPSGTGIRIWIKGKLPGTGRRKKGVEIYDQLRFLTTTGHRLDFTSPDIESRQPVLDEVLAELFPERSSKSSSPRNQSSLPSDDKVLELMATARNGGYLMSLYRDGYEGPDQSSRDFNLLCSLLFWCGGDQAQALRLFSNSGLGQRSKWRDRRDYRERTLKAALGQVTHFYEPPSELSRRVEIVADQ